MSEVLFYHLTQSTLEKALPPLVEKSVERGWRSVIQSGTPERRDALNDILWTWSEESFLAHATDESPDAADNPIVLTVNDTNPNGAHVRFVVDGADLPDFSSYQRGVVMFDGLDPGELAKAREHWKVLKAKGHAVTYWQQESTGKWVKKA